MEQSLGDTPHKQLFKCQTVIGKAFKHCRRIFLIFPFKTLSIGIDALPKGSVFINKIIDTCQDINLSIMKRNGLGVTSAPSCQTFVVLSIVPIATFHIARIDCLSSFLTPDDLDDFVFSAPYDPLLNCNQMTLL